MASPGNGRAGEAARGGRRTGFGKVNRRVRDFDEGRLTKRAQLLDAGVAPYPHAFKPGLDLATLRARADELGGSTVTVAGRISSIREMGKTRFADIYDLDGRVQVYLKKSIIGPEAWDRLKLLDLGDLIGVEGPLFTTKSGELTVEVHALTVLCKTVVPIPIAKAKDGQRWYALSDPDVRYRERYLDWITDEVSRRRFVARSRIIAEIRRLMDADGFMEVSAPILEHVYGGAEARPFTTRVNALSEEEVFLRISLELSLKRFIVGGFPRVYAVGPNFRNEGMDRSHHPEFWMMEWYEAYTDYEDQMRRFEELICRVAQNVLGSTELTYGERTTDLATPWRRVTLVDAVREATGIDVESASVDQLRSECARREVAEESLPGSWGEGVVALFEVACEKDLVGPVIVKDFPLEVSPLTKRKRMPDGSLSDRWVERFEPYLFGMEIGNAYTELTDPVEQAERLRTQSRTAEGVPVDWDFVKAVGCGMPPTGGVGIGVDRLVMILADAPSVRDIIAFPLMKSAAGTQPGEDDQSDAPES
jgi:lysyl-tRNA synthetase class 2